MSTKDNKEPISTYDSGYLDQTLRPASFDEYVGQEGIKKNLGILLKAAKERNHPPEHLLFYGPPGLGKTTLAYLIAKENGSQIKITAGPAVDKVGDLASLLTNLSPGDILFIDEIHRLNKAIEEVLYPAMESGTLNIVLGKGPSARTIQLELPPFTLIAATTRIGDVSSPLRSRFSGGVFKLEFYTPEEIERIVNRTADILKVEIAKEAAKEIASRSRATPRTANYLVKRCRDFAQINKTELNKDVVLKALEMVGIDEAGLNQSDRSLLQIIIEKFAGGPVGISTLSAAQGDETGTIEEFNEPYLMQIGFLERTPRGRTATTRAYRHLGQTPPAEKQNPLI